MDGWVCVCMLTFQGVDGFLPGRVVHVVVVVAGVGVGAGLQQDLHHAAEPQNNNNA